MTIDYYELNENVLYLVETLKYIENAYAIKLNELKEKDERFQEILKLVDLSIKICLNSEPPEEIDLNSFKQKRIKFEMFSYLICKHLNYKTIVPSPVLGFQLLMDLMIENEFEDLVEVYL